MQEIICYLRQCAKTVMIGLVILELLKCLICPNTFDVIILTGLLIVLMSWLCK